MHDRIQWKALIVWAAVTAGSFVGCNCHHVPHCDGGCPDVNLGAACSDTIPCPVGQYCLGGSCTQDCNAQLACPGGATCTMDGHCMGGACAIHPPLHACGNSCGVTMPCPAGLYCDLGSCNADCSSTVPCPMNETCSTDGHCVGGGNDTGACSGAGAPIGCGNACSSMMACPPGTFCLGGLCTAECSGSAPCPTGQECSIDGHCVVIGVDGGAHCTGAQLNCSGVCIDVVHDPDNCGGCGHTCLPSQVCSAAQCMANCPSNQMNCHRRCVNTATDSANCGACDVVCPNNTVCLSSTCGCNIRGTTECEMMCVNLDSHREDCGSCGHVCNTTCASHPDTCVNQSVICGPAGDGCGGTISGGCGGCPVMGDTCGGGGVLGVCGHGATCQPRTTAACPSGYCGPYPDGCGGTVNCPTTCTAPDTCGGGGVLHQCGRPVCHMSGCLDMCPSGWTNCNHVCFDLNNDPSNCGACGRTCGLGTCSGGSCQCMAEQYDANLPHGVDGGTPNPCPPGGCLMCDPDGCVNQMIDPNHCGACTTQCAIGRPCIQGQCG